MKSQPDLKKLIIKNLSKILESDITTEEKALYFMAEVRKARNKQGDDKTPLDLYADWALHIELGSPNFYYDILRRFDQAIKEGMTLEDIKRAIHTVSPDFFKLKDLKQEIETFLKEEALPQNLTNNDRSWAIFVRNLLEVLKEGSIKPNLGNIKELSVETDENGNTSYKFRVSGHSTKVAIKLKWH